MPWSLVGGVMAYQDDAGLLSVKHLVTPVFGLLRHAPRGVQWRPSPWRQLQNRKTDRWNHARRGGFGNEPSLLEVTHGSHALEATPEQPRRVRECTSRSVRMETAVPRDGAVDIRFEDGLRFLREVQAGFDALRATSEPHAVCENHACRGA